MCDLSVKTALFSITATHVSKSYGNAGKIRSGLTRLLEIAKAKL